MKIKAENNSLHDANIQKDKIILTIHEMKMKEEQYIFKINELQKQLDEKSITMKDLFERCEKAEKELKEHVSVYKNRFIMKIDLNIKKIIQRENIWKRNSQQ
jgi:hypothetical protein